ncbi:MAG: SGNH/GDSL hydrolase family protein [Phototrophicaceae bacterium]
MHVVFFGDSLTWGGYGGDYVGEVRVRVGERHHIVNAGEGGNTVVNLNRRVMQDVLSHEPDAVFVMIGGNDVVSYSQPDTRPYYRKAMQLPSGYVDPATFRSEYDALLTTLQTSYAQITVGLPPIEANETVVQTLRDYNGIAHELAAAHSIPVLDLFARYVPADIPARPPVTNKFIIEIGERERTGWNDWYTAQAAGGYTYTFDGVHWTPRIAAAVAEQVITAIGL